MSRNRGMRVAMFVIILSFVATACGGGKEAAKKPVVTGQRGGTLRIAQAADVDYMDPGQIYYNVSYLLFRGMIRTLVNYPALEGAAGTKLVPDIATDLGSVSADALTYSFTIRDGVKYQPEAAGGRQVRSEDFRYAIERGYRPSVANQYMGLYFTDVIVGDDEFAAGKAPHIAGIDVSDPKKVVFHLRRPTGDFLYRLAMPVAAPVPEEYAKPFDDKTPSEYAVNFASMGPYMLERTGGKVTGYVAGKKIVMVRNPSWTATSDPIRKGYPDRIEVTEGVEDPGLATDKVLHGEFDLMGGDINAPSDKIQSILSDPTLKKQLVTGVGSSLFYVALNTNIKPFDDVRVRQAANYVMDKVGMRLAVGGAVSGEIATNVLIPDTAGFDEIGGMGYDPYASKDHAGDVAKAADLMKQAGYSDGKYHGAPVLLVEVDDPEQKRIADVVQASLEKIGIRVKRSSFDANIAFTKYYNVPKAGVAVATSSGWFLDYPDAYTLIKPLFDGRLITPTGNNNIAQLNDPQLNALIDQAAAANGAERARLWAQAGRRVMDLAPVVPWSWGAKPVPRSARVVNALGTFATTGFDLAVLSLKPGS